MQKMLGNNIAKVIVPPFCFNLRYNTSTCPINYKVYISIISTADFHTAYKKDGIDSNYFTSSKIICSQQLGRNGNQVTHCFFGFFYVSRNIKCFARLRFVKYFPNFTLGTVIKSSWQVNEAYCRLCKYRKRMVDNEVCDTNSNLN